MIKKVIIIDDSITQLNILRAIFTKAGWKVYEAQNAKTALNMIYDCAPDLIITDAIMPGMGGFQLIKSVRNEEAISKIPIIVYSVIGENNAKFYLKEDLSEYFLRKEDNTQELVDMAEKIVASYPVDKNYKFQLMRKKLDSKIFEETKSEDEIYKKEPQQPVIQENKTDKFNEEEFRNEFKKIYASNDNDDIIFPKIFKLLYSALNYNLCVFTAKSEKNERTAYFDIKDIILSPVLREKILSVLEAKKSFLYKKYAPNLKMVTIEEDFNSKIEFCFEYLEKETGKIIFYSSEKNKWQDFKNINVIKEVLDDYLKTRHINQSPQNISGYLTNNGLAENIKEGERTYCAIIQIVNFQDLKNNLTQQEIDIINSKISEKIVSYLDKNEQIYKSEEDEYEITIFAKDDNQAYCKLNIVANSLNGISFDENKIEAVISAQYFDSSSNIDISNCKKNARIALDETSRENRVVIK